MLLLGIMVKPVYLFLHMFNAPNGYTVRFAYVLSFVAASAAVRQLSCLQLSCLQPSYLRTIRLRPVAIFLAVTLGFYLVAPMLDRVLQTGMWLDTSFKIMGLIAILMLLWIWLLYRYRKGQSRGGLIFLAILLTMIELVANGYYLMKGMGGVGREIYEIRHQTAEDAITRIKAEDSGIFRIDYPDKHNYNMQTAYDYYGIAYFTSVVNEMTSHAMDRLGYARGDFSIYESYQTDVVKMIFGTKYSVHSPWNKPEGEYEIEKYPYSLPLGYMVREEILSYAFTENVFENQQKLLECMTGEGALCMEIYNGEISLYPQNVNLVQVDQGVGVCGAEVQDGDAYLKFVMPYCEGVRAYVYFSSDLDRNFSSVPLTSGIPVTETLCLEFSSLSRPQTVPMAQEGDNYVVYIIFTDEDTFDIFTLKDMNFALYHEDGLVVHHEELAKAGLQIEVMEDGYVRGQVMASEEKPVLFTSFPYEEGWVAYVDGKEQEIVPLLEGGFIGLRLEPGEHEVELRFTAPYSVQGRWLSLCGLILLMILIVADLYDTKKVKER